MILYHTQSEETSARHGTSTAHRPDRAEVTAEEDSGYNPFLPYGAENRLKNKRYLHVC